MITTNVIRRTFRLKHGDHVGTCFTIDVAGRQYLVTALHLVAGLHPGDNAVVELLHDRHWKALPVHVAWLAEPPADVAILAPSQRLSPAELTLEPTPADMQLGQQVYFLGFTDLEVLAAPGSVGYPMPLVRQGILAGIIHQNEPPKHETPAFVIDGHNIPGFSGGPVVFTPPGSRKFRVAAVISAYRAEPKPVLHQGKPTGLYVADNSGLVIAYGFKAGIEHITANPTGVETTTA